MADENTQDAKKTRIAKPLDQRIAEATEKLKKLQNQQTKINNEKRRQENRIVDRAKYIIGGYILSSNDWENRLQSYIDNAQECGFREQDIEALKSALGLLKEREEAKAAKERLKKEKEKKKNEEGS